MSSVLILVPAKGTSRGVPRKNLADLCGKPLVWWTIEQAKAAKVGAVVVSTDDDEIRDLVLWDNKAYVRNRPAEFATDEASTESVMLDLLDNLLELESDEWLSSAPIPDILVVLQPTSPLRLAKHIVEALSVFERFKDVSSVASVVPFHGCTWEADMTIGPNPRLHIACPKWQGSEKKQRKRRQEIQPEFVENGSIYAVRVPKFLEEKTRFCGHVILYEMPEWTRYEIDNHADLGLIRTILRQRMEMGSDGINS